jgi:hypothetical protein
MKSYITCITKDIKIAKKKKQVLVKGKLWISTKFVFHYIRIIPGILIYVDSTVHIVLFMFCKCCLIS